MALKGPPGRPTQTAAIAEIAQTRDGQLRDVSDRLGRAMEGRLMAAIKGKPTEGP